MLRYPRTLGVYVLLLPLLALSRSVPAQAAPPPEQLLPNTTREFCACPNVKETLAGFRATQFGRLLNDPQLSGFLKDVEAQIEKGGGLDVLGFALGDLEQIAGGETAWATVEIARRQPGEVLLVDVTGKHKELAAALSARSRRWQESGGIEKNEQQAGLLLIIQEKPARKNNRPEVRVHCLKDNLLIVSDNRGLVEGAAQRLAAADGSSLSELVAFSSVQSQTIPHEGEKAQVRFFVDPFGMLCLDDASGQGSKKTAVWNQLRKAGLDGLKGFGGFLSFANQEHDFFYRAALCAEVYKKAMAIFNLVESEELTPPCWIRGPVASYTTFHIDFPKAFEGLGPIYDQVLVDGEEGTFKETLADLKKDPKVRLDVCEELINQLGSRVILVTDHPAGRKSNRFLAAIPVKNSKVVADAVARFYTGDDRVKNHNFQERCTVWEMGTPPKGGPGEGKETLDIPYHVVSVTQKYLFLSNSRDMLTEVLGREQEQESPETLAQHSVYQQIHKAAVRLGCGKGVCQQFTNGADDLRDLYEAVRRNALAAADSLQAQLILQVLQAGKLKLRGDLLPEYSQVSQHLGMGGAFIRATPEGLEMIGFYPRKTK